MFDPVVGFTGEWLYQALKYPATDFCAFSVTMRPVVIEIARGGTVLSDDEPPHPQQVCQALRGCMKHLWYLPLRRLLALWDPPHTT